MAAPELAGSEVVLIEVGREEINQWKRGFTPQAEIWNGRMAMLGLSIGLGSLLLVRLIGDIGGAH
ncbi:high light inducible protein [Synechococcus sp. GreenBA-s]|nr:high light inducible protein [Synechococcus sp. GreenBA-s]